MKNYSYMKLLPLFSFCGLLILACQKNDYYADGGLSMQSEAEKNMTTYDFLSTRRDLFDSLLKIIDLTDSKEAVNQSNITFFAATNSVIVKFMNLYNPKDNQPLIPINQLNKDTLRMLLYRFIIPNDKVMLEDVVQEKVRYCKDLNGDSVNLNRLGGGINAGSSIQTSAFSMEYEHRRIPLVDTINYKASMQTHNLQTSNARLHVLRNDANFGCGLNMLYYRVN